MMKTAIVTGSHGAIGEAACRILANRGWMVAAADLDAGDRDYPWDSSYSDAIRPFSLDVTDEESVATLFTSVIDQIGPCTTIVNNAGITRDAIMHKMEKAAFESVISVNLTGPFLMTRELARYLRASEMRGGSIVNISSISGKVGNVGQANYSASKAGLIGLTKVAAKELARFDITVNAVLPGFIDTSMTRAIPESKRLQRISEIPLERPGTPEDVGKMIAWLCGEDARYLTGAGVEVSGGLRM